jgi:putative ABC transport system ATP-binding protein
MSRGRRTFALHLAWQNCVRRRSTSAAHCVSCFCGPHNSRRHRQLLSASASRQYFSRLGIPGGSVSPLDSQSSQRITPSAPQVVVESLVKQYGPLRALDDVTFSVAPGEWVALMGPSGSGKTTLINILGGLDTLTSGRVFVDDVDLSKRTETQLVRYRSEKVGFVFQQFHLIPYLSALENVMLAQYFHSVTDEKQAQDALRRVGLGDRLTHLPAQLSGGEQQRVAIARALINQPKLILADEPTGNLDEANEALVIDIFRALHNAGHTILMVTHDPDIARQAGRRIELAHGHLSLDTTQTDIAISIDEEIRFDHLLERIWMCGEEGSTNAQLDSIQVPGALDSARALGRMVIAAPAM